MGGTPLNGPVVGMAVAPGGAGYWQVASDGGIFAFNVPFRGSMGNQPLARPVTGMVMGWVTAGASVTDSPWECGHVTSMWRTC